MIVSFLARTNPLHAAKTRGERESIYRFRYSIYARELKREYPGMDHVEHMLRDEYDELPETRLWYTGNARHVTGTARARIWDAPPDDVVEEFSLARLPKAKYALLERLMVRPNVRGRALLPAMIWNGYAHLMEENVDFCILTCVPGLVRHYVRMGARPYGAKVIEGASSLEVPLIICMNDPDYLKSIGSFMYPQVKKHSKKGFNRERMEPLFAPDAQWVRFEQPPLAGKLFEGLPEDARSEIAKRSFVLHVAPRDLVVRKGTMERELYLVLDGELQVEGRDVRITRDALIGEVGFLGTSGVRTATVRAVTPGRVLVLSRKFLDDLARTRPHLAYLVSRNLARMLADRFTETRK